jgi:hypothetical protein
LFCNKKRILILKESLIITANETETATGCIYGENCPLHAENPPFNAKVLAAIQEAKDIESGKIPGKCITLLKKRERIWTFS